jgi:hypothetical protein
VKSTYGSTLGTNSKTFSRDQCGTSKYQYEAAWVNVSLDGYVTFCGNSKIDTYAYFYENTFDPLDLDRDLIASDDDGCGNQQFRLCLFLQTNTRYLLVVTTHAENMVGAFSVAVVGGAQVNFTRMDRIGE